VILKVENLVKKYGSLEAVKGISFEIDRGEVFSIVGPNGAGKTTTIKCITGLRNPTSGNIVLNGAYSYLPEEKRLYKSYTIEKMLEISGYVSKYFDKKRAYEFIKRFKLPLDEKVANLSHGMMTQLYLAIVFSEDVDLYILDEPTWGLDPVIRNEVLEIIREMAMNGKSFLITTHILPEVEKITDKVAIMKDGSFVEMDYLDELKEKYVAVVVEVNKRVEGGYLYKTTSQEKVYIVEKERAKGDYQPVDFETIFQALVKGEKK